MWKNKLAEKTLFQSTKTEPDALFTDPQDFDLFFTIKPKQTNYKNRTIQSPSPSPTTQPSIPVTIKTTSVKPTIRILPTLPKSTSQQQKQQESNKQFNTLQTEAQQQLKTSKPMNSNDNTNSPLKTLKQRMKTSNYSPQNKEYMMYKKLQEARQQRIQLFSPRSVIK